MADYYPLIAHAVESLDKNTGENRRALYERARTALVAQLRGVQPALEESEITRERLALEEAIRKIEAESARRAREEARAATPRRSEARRDAANAPSREHLPAAAALPATASEDVPRQHSPDAATARPSGRRSLAEEAMRGYRDGVNDPHPAPPPPRPARPAYAERPSHAERTSHAERPPAPPPEPHPLEAYGELEPRVPPEELWNTPLETASAERPDSRGRTSGRPKPPRQEALDDDAPRARSSISVRQIVLVAGLLLIVVIGAAAWWQRGAISDAVSGAIAWVRTPSTPAQPQQPTTQVQPKISDRIGQPQTPQPGAPVAQRVVLYEEDPDDPQGKRLLGSVIWSTETIPAAPGRQAELAVRAKIEIPERKMTVTWSLRRNTDQALPASHTIEIMFNLPPDSPSGGVQNVPGVLMKQSEQTRGVPLAGLAVKVTPGYFLIGLSSLESDMQRNLQLLKERSWFDIPVVYNNNRRAILALEKGIPGEKAFNDAFAAWKQ